PPPSSTPQTVLCGYSRSLYGIVPCSTISIYRILCSVAETQRLLTVYTYPCTVKPMKRCDLERALRQLGWYFLRHGGKHDVWTDGKREEAIPRPTEIHDKLAQAILRRVKGSA